MGNSAAKRTSKVHVEEATKVDASPENMPQDSSSSPDPCIDSNSVVARTNSSDQDTEMDTKQQLQAGYSSTRPNSCSPTQKQDESFVINTRSRSGESLSQFRYTPEQLIAQSSLTVEKATSHCKVLLMQLSTGTHLDSDQLKQSLSYIMDVLQSIPAGQRDSISSLGCGRLETLDDDEVRAWLTNTFTHSISKQSSSVESPKPSFKAVVDTIMVGQYFQKKIQDIAVSYPDGVEEFFQTSRDQWYCDVFQLHSLTSGQPLKYFGHEIFKFYGFTEHYKISNATLNSFLEVVEKGYKKHDNPYHNSIHATDVAQTVHYFIQSAGLQKWLSDIEILSMIFAALIHDLEHTGTFNSFHVKTRSELALCYNDISVLENYHLFRAFSILAEESTNIFKGVSNEDFVTLRTLVIEMVLATDMSKHFDHLKYMKKLIQNPDDAWTKIRESDATDRPKVLSLFLHMADISHPGKKLDLHKQWTDRLVEEFFRQGDREKKLELACSPMCDRNTTRVPESQTGFIKVIVSPSYDICGSYLELIVRKSSENQQKQQSVSPESRASKTAGTDPKVGSSTTLLPPTITVTSSSEGWSRVWDQHLEENMKYWTSKCNPQKSIAVSTADED